VLNAFRAGKLKTLVATDIAARGIDVTGISHVVNYDLPNIPESYVHRIGRTARAGAAGVATSFCDHEERAFLRDIEKLIQMTIPSTDRRTAPHAADRPAKHHRPQQNAGRHGHGRNGQQQRNGHNRNGHNRNGKPARQERHESAKRHEPRAPEPVRASAPVHQGDNIAAVGFMRGAPRHAAGDASRNTR
jgi:superfamily II DNA/RNA helicase